MKQAVIFVWQYIVAVTLLFVCALALHFWPASWWFDVRSISVASGLVSEKLAMTVDRTIKRPFVAGWSVTLRQWDGGWVVVCRATGDGDYRLDAKFPTNLTLAWWTANQCHPLPPGKYMLSTTWTIRGLGIIPDKIVQATSNTFEITN